MGHCWASASCTTPAATADVEVLVEPPAAPAAPAAAAPSAAAAAAQPNIMGLSICVTTNSSARLRPAASRLHRPICLRMEQRQSSLRFDMMCTQQPRSPI